MIFWKENNAVATRLAVLFELRLLGFKISLGVHHFPHATSGHGEIVTGKLLSMLFAFVVLGDGCTFSQKGGWIGKMMTVFMAL